MECSNPISAAILDLCGATNSGGIKTTLYIAEFENVTGVTAAGGTVTSINMALGTSFYPIRFRRNTSNVTEAGELSPENGTIVITQTATVLIPKIQVTTRQRILEYSNKKLILLIQDQNTNWRLFGENNGCYMTQFDNATGTALRDANGYTLTFTSEEPVQAQFVTAAAVDAVNG